MGVIQKQSIQHSIVSYLGLALGVFSLVFIYPLELKIYGLFQALYSSSSIIMAIFIFGQSLSVVKFFPDFFKNNKDIGLLGLGLLVILAGYICYLVLFDILKVLQLEYLFIEDANREYMRKFIYFQIPLVALLTLDMYFGRYISNFKKIVIPNILSQLLIKITLPILILSVYFGWFDETYFLIGILTHFFIVVLGLVAYLIYLGRFHLNIHWSYISKTLLTNMTKYSLFGFGNAIGAQLSFRIDILMVAGMVNVTSGGIYSLISLFVNVISKPILAINAISGPIISANISARKFDEIGKIFSKSSNILFLIGSYIFLCIWLNIDDIIGIMPNSNSIIGFKEVALFAGLGQVINCLTSIDNLIVVYSKKYKYNLAFTLILAVINICLNLILIPKYDMIGAAMATMLSMMIFSIMKVILIYRSFGIHPFTKSTMTISIFGLLCWMTISYIQFDFHPLISMIIRCAILSLVYLFMLLRFQVSEEAYNLVRKYMRKLFGNKS